MASLPVVAPDEPEDEGPDLEAFVAFLKEEEGKSHDEYLDDERANALDFYNGELFGDEEDGRSQVVTRDVAEVVDYMTVSLLRTMVSGEKVVEFDYPESPKPLQRDEQGQPIPRPPSIAEQATAAVAHEFYQGQDGYRFLHDWIKAGLLEKTSTAKVCVEPQKPKRVIQELHVDELTMLEQRIQELPEDERPSVVAAEPMDDQGTMFRVVAMIPQPPRFRDYVSPNEETRIASDARDLDDDCAYSGYAMQKTLSQLAEMGFDTEDVTDDSYGMENGSLSAARDAGIPQYSRQSSNRQGANRKVWHFEEYSTYDLDGDGIAELVQSHRVGNQILRYRDGSSAIEEIDEQPGVVWCPFPMPHRIIGQSLADKVMDIQRTRSVAQRQTFDSFYFANNARVFVPIDGLTESTIDDLLTVRPGGIVRYKGIGKPEIQTSNSDPSAGMALMEMLAGEKESRTGITRLNQGLDADTLNKTATGTALMQAQGQQIEEYLARNFAEALARLFRKKYNLMRKYGRPIELMIDGQLVTIDPREWPEDMNVVVRVGLGSGRKDQRLQYRQMLLEMVQAAVQGGSRVFTDENIYNMFKGVIADAGLGNLRELATDPSTLPEQPEEPDPKLVEAQMKAKQAQDDLEFEKMKGAAQLELERERNAAKIEMERERNDQKIQLETAKAAQAAQLKEREANFEASLAERKAQFDAELRLREADHKHELAVKAADEMPKNRPGGDLSK